MPGLFGRMEKNRSEAAVFHRTTETTAANEPSVMGERVGTTRRSIVHLWKHLDESSAVLVLWENCALLMSFCIFEAEE